MILSYIENFIVDDMTHKQIRYIEPVVANKAEGKLSRLYDQIRSDFQLVPPLTLFSPAPDLLSAVWGIWRESQFAMGRVPRYITEAIAAGVSSINTCPYCVDAHTGMLHAFSDNDVVKAIHHRNSSLIKNDQCRRIVEWSLANRSPGAKILTSPPFSRNEAPEIIGTAVVYHFVNRMVTIFLADSPLPVPSNWAYIRRIAAKIFGVTVGKSIVKREPQAGRSLDVISTEKLPDDMEWALENSHIASAFTNISALMHNAGEQKIPEQVRNFTLQHINAWEGIDMGMNRSWLEDIVNGLDRRDKPIARIIMLTALAPYQVCENDIEEFRSIQLDDDSLLMITAWASFAAARRIGSWLYIP